MILGTVLPFADSFSRLESTGERAQLLLLLELLACRGDASPRVGSKEARGEGRRKRMMIMTMMTTSTIGVVGNRWIRIQRGMPGLFEDLSR